MPFYIEVRDLFFSAKVIIVIYSQASHANLGRSNLDWGEVCVNLMMEWRMVFVFIEVSLSRGWPNFSSLYFGARIQLSWCSGGSNSSCSRHRPGRLVFSYAEPPCLLLSLSHWDTVQVLSVKSRCCLWFTCAHCLSKPRYLKFKEVLKLWNLSYLFYDGSQSACRDCIS